MSWERKLARRTPGARRRVHTSSGRAREEPRGERDAPSVAAHGWGGLTATTMNFLLAFFSLSGFLSGWNLRACQRRFGRISASFSSSRGQQAALKYSLRSDGVARECPLPF